MATSIPIIYFLFTFTFIKVVGANVGVNYGRVANNLPPPSQVAKFILESTVIDHVKLYDADPSTIQAFAHTGVSIDVAVSNELIQSLKSLTFARHWVRARILPYAHTTNITRILVGNEVISTAKRSLIGSLLPAMQNLHTALAAVSLDHRIKVSTPHSLSILSSSSPPSAGRFRSGYDNSVIKPLISFLRATNSDFMVNTYPFFGFSPETLDYALFRPNNGVIDHNTNLLYTNMLDAQLDAVFSAIKLLGFDDVTIVVAETGWPSVGDPWQVGVDIENARDYNKNLVRHLASGMGTPLMPNRTFEAYIFALFNENLKPGPVSERNFGLFQPDMSPVYDIGILKNEARIPRSMSPPMNPTMNSGGKRWCLPKPNVDPKSLQENIDYACGQGINCSPIQSSGACFLPNTVKAHAAYAMNEFYQVYGRNFFDCDFGQTGIVTSVNPSYGNCKYNA
ncbi:glucan endo-1,3-beta-glucosidase [Asparagus officinalis]|nr:glucan endo-1,3-beta-glucosidase [Asparagus officinalis]